MTSGATVPGMFSLVLHSHLPWLANHGRWPVGEEWIYQSWAASYIPLAAALRRLADEGRSHLLTLGITPVLAAQLDDPHCLAGMHHWLGNWQIRAHEAAGMPDAAHRELDAAELTELLVDARLEVDELTGVRHGRTLAALDAKHGGSFINAQIDRALAGEPWPEDLTRDVEGITVDDFSISEPDIDDSLDLVAIAVKETGE